MNIPAIDLPEFDLNRNQIETFSAIRWDNDTGGRPIYSLSFNKLASMSGSLGVFNTALYKTITVENLCARFHHYSDKGRSEQQNALLPVDAASALPIEGTSPDRYRLESTLIRLKRELVDELLNTLKRRNTKCSLLVDVGNPYKIVVRDLDYAFYENNKIRFGVKCRRATFLTQTKELELRGRVVIQARDGRILRSNCVVWHLKDKSFVVPGAYMLTHNGDSVTGRGFQCDEQLRTVLVSHGMKVKG